MTETSSAFNALLGDLLEWLPDPNERWSARRHAIARVTKLPGHDDLQGKPLVGVKWLAGHRNQGDGDYYVRDFRLLTGLRDLGAESVLAYLLAET